MRFSKSQFLIKPRLSHLALAWILGISLQLQQAQLWDFQSYLKIFIISILCFLFFLLIGLISINQNHTNYNYNNNNNNNNLNNINQYYYLFKLILNKFLNKFLNYFLNKFLNLRSIFLCLTIIGFAFSATGLRAVSRLDDALLPELEGQNLVVIGVIAKMPQRLENGQRFLFEVESAFLNEKAVHLPPLLWLSWYDKQNTSKNSNKSSNNLNPFSKKDGLLGNSSNNLNSFLKKDGLADDEDDIEISDLIARNQDDYWVQAGQRWKMSVRLKQAYSNRNPNGFDYELWLWEQNIRATGSVRVNKGSIAPELLGFTGFYLIEQWRQKIRDSIFEHFQIRAFKIEQENEKIIENNQNNQNNQNNNLNKNLHNQNNIENKINFNNLSDDISKSLKRQAGIIAALVTGDQRSIDSSDWTIFRITGVAHLMSISGLHITMLAWLAARFADFLWRRGLRYWSPRSAWWTWLPAQKIAVLVGWFTACFYALFSGWAIPAQRTVLMLGIHTYLQLSGRRFSLFDVLLLSAAIVTAYDPWSLLQAGFWLSFVAVAILFASDMNADLNQNQNQNLNLNLNLKSNNNKNNNKNKNNFLNYQYLNLIFSLLKKLKIFNRFNIYFQKLKHALNALWREQWMLSLALAPLTLLLFGQVSVVGLLANLLAIPLVTLLITPLALLGILHPSFWTFSAWFLNALIAFLEFCAHLPFAMIFVASSPLLVGAWGLFGGLLLSLRLPWRWKSMAFLMLLPLLFWQPLRPSLGEFELLFFDIGQGNAVLVRTKNHTLLYDSGASFSGASDAGQRLILPVLQAHQDELDLLVLSHRDSDHTGGALSVLNAYPKAHLLASLEKEHSLWKARPKSRQTCEAGQTWIWDDVKFEVLHPFPNEDNPQISQSALSKMSSNAASCVLKITSANNKKALLLGDLEAAQERLLLDKLNPLNQFDNQNNLQDHQINNQIDNPINNQINAQFNNEVNLKNDLKDDLKDNLKDNAIYIKKENVFQKDFLKADILLVGHHGSKTSSTAPFLRAINPRWALVQAGYRNHYGHPAALVLSRFHELGIPVENSVRCGAATWQSNNINELICEREQNPHYWQFRAQK